MQSSNYVLGERLNDKSQVVLSRGIEGVLFGQNFWSNYVMNKLTAFHKGVSFGEKITPTFKGVLLREVPSD